jgi:plastocyanin
MSGTFLFFIMLLGSLHPTVVPQKTFVGCLNQLPNGTLQLGAVPSGQLYVVRGRANVIEEHVNQLVRVYGAASRNSNNNYLLPTLTVNRIQALAESCTSSLPGKQFEGVPGKVGEDSVAVPATSTPTEAETTPGFQTEAATAQSSRSRSVPLSLSMEPPAAPTHPDQVGQSEAAANVNSSAVERTEILPGGTLGVAPTVGSTQIQPAAAQVAEGGAATSPAQAIIVTIGGRELPQLSPPHVNIKVGQVVEWLNSSGAVQEVIANPARATQPSNATLPAGAKPFDSGFLHPGQSFRYRFSIPGRYGYLCKVNSFNGSKRVSGEVVVEP